MNTISTQKSVRATIRQEIPDHGKDSVAGCTGSGASVGPASSEGERDGAGRSAASLHSVPELPQTLTPNPPPDMAVEG